MTGKKIVFRNSEIHYSVQGNGPALMLVHGFGEDGSIWEQQAELLKKTHLLIIPDLPGSGQSELLTAENTGLEDYAEVLKAILDNEKLPQCIMIGHSMGGYTSLAFAEKYPGLLQAFGLFHSSALPDDTEKVSARKKSIEFIQENGAAAFLKTAIPGLFYNQSNSAADINELLEKGRSFSKEALVQYYQAMFNRPNRTAVLRNAQKPVLFILGEHDKAVPFEAGLKQVHLPRLSMVAVLRNSAHMGMLEERALAEKILVEFLDSLV